MPSRKALRPVQVKLFLAIINHDPNCDLQEEDARSAEEDDAYVGDGGEVGDWNAVVRLDETHLARERIRPKLQRDAAHDQERLHVGAEQGDTESCWVRNKL